MPISYQAGFSAGAVSRDFESNIDLLPSYTKACRAAMNMIVKPQGSAVRRAGFAEFSQQDEQVLWSIGFSINLVSENYVLHFISDKVLVTRVESGVVTNVGSNPYTRAQLEKLSWAQTNTALVLATAGVSPKVFKRLDDGTFEFRDANFTPGPVLDQNTTAATVYIEGGIEIGQECIAKRERNGSGYDFNAPSIGGTFAISEKSNDAFLYKYTQWEVNKSITANEYVVVGGKVLYRALNAGTTKVPPTHQQGDQTLDGIVWRFWNKGTGYFKMIQHLGLGSIRGIVLVNLPPLINTIETATRNFNDPAFCEKEGFPVAVTIFQDRLVFAGSNVTSTYAPQKTKNVPRDAEVVVKELEAAQAREKSGKKETMAEQEAREEKARKAIPKRTQDLYADLIAENQTQRLWASTVGDYGNFDTSGDLEERAIAVDVTSGKNNRIVWLASTDSLLVGTQGGVFPLKSLRSPDTIVDATRNVSDSCASIQPILLNNLLIYVPQTKGGLKSVIFNDDAQVFQSQLLTFRNTPIFRDIVTIAEIQEPANTIIALRESGTLALLSFDVTQQLVTAFEWSITGEKISSLCSIGSKVFITTESERSGALDVYLTTDLDYRDFGEITSEAYIDTLPVGAAGSGQVIGFFNDVMLSEIRVAYFDTQGLAIDNSGDLIGRRAASGEDVSPLDIGYVKTTLAKSNGSVRIRSLDNAALGIASYGISYTTNS